MPEQNKPLKITMGRWLTDTDEEAELRFDFSPEWKHAEMDIQWGPGPRQQRTYLLQESDLLDLHEWLAGVLGLET